MEKFTQSIGFRPQLVYDIHPLTVPKEVTVPMPESDTPPNTAAQLGAALSAKERKFADLYVAPGKLTRAPPPGARGDRQGRFPLPPLVRPTAERTRHVLTPTDH